MNLITIILVVFYLQGWLGVCIEHIKRNINIKDDEPIKVFFKIIFFIIVTFLWIPLLFEDIYEIRRDFYNKE